MIRIGKIVATHGLTGTLIMTHVLETSKWLKKGDTLMLELQKGSYIPYFVAQCKAGVPGEYLITLEDVTTPLQAKKLVTKTVYVGEALLTPYAKKSPLLWIGFKVMDEASGEIGIIDDVLMTGTQWLARVMRDGKEILLPLVEQTILNIEHYRQYHIL